MKAKVDVRKRIEGARKSLQAGDYARALSEIDEVLRLDESNTEAMSLRDQIAAAREREAVALAADAVQRAASENDPDKRIEILHAAAVRNPEDQHLQMLLVLNESRRDVLAGLAARARFFDRKRRFDDALEQLRLLETLQPSYPGLDDLKSTILRHQAHPEEIVDEPLPAPPVTPVTQLPPAPQPTAAPPAAPPPPTQAAPAPEQQPEPATSPAVAQKPVVPVPPSKAPAPSSSRWTLLAGLAAAVVLIAAAVAFYLYRGSSRQPQGNFELALQPPDARMEIDGKPQDAASLHLVPGSYKVKVTRPGYKTYEQQVTYSGGPLRFTLEPLIPLIRIDTDVTGGEYSVDDGALKPLEDGQANLGDLPPGHHKLKVNLPKYGESTAEVETLTGQAPRFVSATPAKEVVSFAISSFDTEGSLHSSLANLPVKLESGEALGTTDQAVTIKGTSGGEQRLAIGEGDQQRLLTAMFDSRPEFAWFLRIAAATSGGVRVTADQDDVIVKIDGRPQATRLKGNEPHSFRDLSPGSHEVRVEKPGYVSDPVSKRITVANGREERVQFRLLGFATVDVKGAPPGAHVLINNAPAGSIGADGSGHFSVAAKDGNCRLELKQENFLHKAVEKPCKPGEPVAFSGDEVKMVPTGYLVWEKYEPKDATITITRKGSNEKSTYSPPRVELPVGKYSVVVSAPGYESHSDPDVEVLRGRESSMVYELKREK